VIFHFHAQLLESWIIICPWWRGIYTAVKSRASISKFTHTSDNLALRISNEDDHRGTTTMVTTLAYSHLLPAEAHQSRQRRPTCASDDWHKVQADQCVVISPLASMICTTAVHIDNVQYLLYILRHCCHRTSTATMPACSTHRHDAHNALVCWRMP